VAGSGTNGAARVELLGRGVEGPSRVGLARVWVIGLAGIFGRLWRGAFGRNGGLNKGAVGLGASAGAGAGVGVGTGTGVGTGAG